jgi:predicted nucleotidyltransferase
MGRDEILNGLREYKEQNDRRYGIKSLGLFGSLARNEERTDSDIDIVVELEKADMFVLADIKDDIEEAFGRHVDIVRKRESMNALLKSRISQEAIYV